MGLTGSILAGPMAITTLAGPIASTAPCQQEYYFEATPFYGFATNHQFNASTGLDKINMSGGDLTLGKQICAKSSINIRLAYGYGSENGYENIDDTINYGRASVHSFALMPGYRHSWQMTPQIDLFTGVNFGIANQSIKGKVNDPDERVTAHDSDWGVQYSVELGMTYDFNETWYGVAAVQFLGNTCTPEKSEYDIKGKKQQYFSLRLGVGMKF